MTRTIKLLVITGNPVKGLSYIGPFDDHDQVDNWLKQFVDDTDYWIVEMILPILDEGEDDDTDD